MENSFYYNTSSINFIKILFRIFLVFFVVSVILIFSLNVNDTVEFREGLIYSNTPQLKINAPNEVKILKVFVKEGQEVKQGDEMGFIKFGSRIDIYLPLTATVNVQLQQKTRGGETVVATLA